MDPSASAGRRPWQWSRPPRTVLIILFLVALLPVPLISAWTLTTHYARVLADAEAKTDNLARVFASHAAHAVGEFERDLNALAQQLTDEAAVRKSNEPRLHRLLKDHVVSSTHFVDAVIIDAQGMIIAGVRDYPREMNSAVGRPHFRFHRDNATAAMFFGPAFTARTARQPIITVSRRLSASDGSFIGVVSLALSPEYFSRVYFHVPLGDSGIVELFNRAGVVLARAPGGEAVIGASVNLPGHIQLPEGDDVVRYDLRFPSDGIERIVSVARVERFPLFVQVAVSRNEALAPWREELDLNVMTSTLATLGLLGLMTLLLRQYSRLIDTERSERHHVAVLQSTIESMADAVVVVSDDGTVLLANPSAAELFGDRVRVGSKERAWNGNLSSPHDDRPMARALRREAVDNIEIIVRPPSAAEDRYLVANGRPIQDATGSLKGAVVVYSDMTKVRETERQLREIQKMEAMGQLTGGIAHDFNNILTVITGTVSLLKDAVAAKPEYATAADLIEKAANRGADLTRHLLAFARKQALQSRATDINGLLVDTIRLLRPSLGEQVDIQIRLDDDAWPVLIDPSQLTTAILNLSLNARDAMPSGGVMTLETSNVVLDESYANANAEVRPGHYVLISVSDTGTGIAADVKEKIFEPFFTTKEVGRGTGLGLSMVYGFVKQSGGHIKAYSEVGYGTTMKLYLPRAVEVSTQLAMETPASPVQGGDETILVVEDDALVRDYVTVQLKGLGYKPLVARNAAEALALVIDGAQFELLFTDVIMPGSMNGRELAEAMAKLRPELKVLYTSGYTEDVILRQGYIDRSVFLLPKPYSKSDLAQTIRAALSSSGTGPGRAAAK